MKTSPFFLFLALILVACVPAGIGAGEPAPTPQAVLQASDPATFVRAAGKPQLVEFFAFW